MRFAFRADASFAIGSGHVSRCLTLGETLRESGHEVMFISRELDGNMNARVRDTGIDVRELPCPDPAGLVDGDIYAQMLGVSIERDAAETLDAIASFHPDWMIADHYGIGPPWQKMIRQGAGKVMVIDDLANRVHDCDMLLDQNLFMAGEARYRGLVPTGCQLLIGPGYALINREYARRRAEPARERTGLARILLYFGGGNTLVALLKSLAVLAESEFSRILVDVVADPRMAGFGDVKAAVENRPHTLLHPPLPHLADLTGAADLVIGGSGASTWERMCLGVPSIVVVMAENQRQLANELAQSGLIANLGDIDELDANSLRNAVRKMQHPDIIDNISAKLMLKCDGRGANRTADRLLEFR